MLTAERSRFAQGQLKFSKTVEGHKRRVDDMEKKLRDKENELDETKRTLRVVEDELEKSRGLAKRLQLAESHFAKWTPARVRNNWTN